MSIKTILSNASNHLSRLWNGQLLAFLFFLGLSAAFWVFNAGKEQIEHPFTVAIDLIDVPDNVVITTEPPRTVTLMLRDEAFTLMNYKYRRLSRPRVKISWRDVQKPSGHVQLLTADVLASVKDMLQSTTEVLATDPDTIEFYYSYGHSKALDVCLQGIIRPDSAYALIATDVSPRKVTAYASQAILDTLTGAYLRPLNVTQLKDSAHYDVAFVPVKGVKFVPNHVRVTALADRLVDKTVQVMVRGVNFPAGKVLRTFPPKVDVSFQIGAKFYNSIDASAFTIAINYADLLELDGNVCPIRLRSTPEGVQRARIQPAEVEFIIEDDSE